VKLKFRESVLLFLIIGSLVAMAVGALGTFYWTRQMVVSTSQVMFPGVSGDDSGTPLKPLGPLPPQHELGTPTPWGDSPLNPNGGAKEPPRYDF
jgi:hypothetical protein